MYKVLSLNNTIISIKRLIEIYRKNELEKLRDELSKAGGVTVIVYKIPRFEIKIRSPGKGLVKLDNGVLNRLEYALFKGVLEASKNNKLPTFKEIADLSGDYKACAKYLTLLTEMGYIVFPDPVKASKLVEATKAISESKYQRRVRKVLDLPIILNFETLERDVNKVNCLLKNNKLYCDFFSHGEKREQEKLQIALINEYL